MIQGVQAVQQFQPKRFPFGKDSIFIRGERAAFAGGGDVHLGNALGADGQAVPTGSAGGSPGVGQEEQGQGAAGQQPGNLGPECGFSVG